MFVLLHIFELLIEGFFEAMDLEFDFGISFLVSFLFKGLFHLLEPFILRLGQLTLLNQLLFGGLSLFNFPLLILFLFGN